MRKHLKQRVEFVRTHPDAKLPTKGSDGAAGFDIYAVESVMLYPNVPVLVDTGLKISIPTGYEGQVRPRSGLALKGITVLNSPGTIDEDYLGTFGVILMNVSSCSYRVEAGDRIAQLVVKPVVPVCMKLVDEFTKISERGEGGFGSSGR
jgi:dUTP pyrophosphatase